MAKTIELLQYLRAYPVFDSTIVQNKIGTDRKYTALVLHRLKKSKMILKIEKDKYTIFDDPFLIASRIAWPSYISCWSALNYHHLTDQIPQNIWVATTRSKNSLLFSNTKIIFIKIKTSYFFGYEKIKNNNFDIFMATPEKAIIDSILARKISFSEVKEIICSNEKKIRISKFINYLAKVGNRSLIKRAGFLLDSIGKDNYHKLKRYIDAGYIPLDWSKKPIGKKNEKWRLIINA